MAQLPLQTAGAGSSKQGLQQKPEYIIRIATKPEMHKLSVLKFSQSDNVDPAKWTEKNEVHLEREDNRNVVLASQTVQEFGEGTEYGKAAREEARRKKYGRQARTYKLDQQPWRLTFTDDDGKERKMNSIREGEGNADYWVFMKNGEEFHAYKVDEMHRFTPAIKYKTLDAEQAEEKFQQRNKVMNLFAQKAQILNQMKEEDDGEKLLTTKSGNLKIKDEYSSSGSEADEDAEEAGKDKKKKKQKPQAMRKDKRQRVENADDVAKYESSEGEDEGREYDYMTDSGSESDREEVKAEDKVEKELIGVGDESGLKKMIDSDSESDSDDDLMSKILKGDTEKKAEDMDVEERDSSGSDTDDPDKEKISSVVFMQNVQKRDNPSGSNGLVNPAQGKKRPVEADEDGNPAKKSKTDAGTNEGLNEETVRKYLRRKPHTTKELLSKMKGKCGDMPKAEIVTRLAAILKAIEPQQFKQRQGKKEVLFFSLGNQLAR